MKARVLFALLPLLVLALAPGPAAAQKLYRWVDEKGQIHYGDKIPPQYAGQDRDVLNKQGVSVGHEEGSETPAETQARRERAQQARIAEERAQRDRMLLQTYQSVEDIEALRQRRLELLDGQILIQEQSLASLRSRHAEQVRRASRYSPANTDPAAAPMPDGLAEDIARSRTDIRTQEHNLAKKRAERAAQDRQFDADVARYRELRRVVPD